MLVYLPMDRMQFQINAHLKRAGGLNFKSLEKVRRVVISYMFQVQL